MARLLVSVLWLAGAVALALSPFATWYGIDFVPSGGEPLQSTTETGIDAETAACIGIMVIALAAAGLAATRYVVASSAPAIAAAMLALAAIVVVIAAASSPAGEGEIGTLADPRQSFIDVRKEVDTRAGVWVALGGAGIVLVMGVVAALMPTAPRRKQCPHCISKVPVEAKVCKHCGHTFSLAETSRRPNPL